MIQQEDILYGTISTSGMPGPKGEKGEPGASKWSDVEEKPFNSIGDNLVVVDGILSATPGEERQETWNTITGKPFETLGDDFKVEEGVLKVNTANSVEQDNTKPITSGAVFTEVGNINILLSLI